MNFIAATVELKEFVPESVKAYGLDYVAATAVIPGNNESSQVKLRLLCYDRQGPKLDGFKAWKSGTRALVTGNLVFSDDTSAPLDLVVTTLENSIPQDMYCNQVVLGNAFFGSDEIKERKNGQVAIKIGSTLDNSDITTWLFMETHESRKAKLTERVRKGRPICVQGYIREFRKEGDTSPYRAIVANDFTTRKETPRTGRGAPTTGGAKGYGEVDPTPEY